MASHISRITERLAPHRAKLLNHPIYQSLNSIEDLKVFMELHVYPVWDFMSLLKALQNGMTGNTLPWTPGKLRQASRLILEIVHGEETDIDPQGQVKSHYELYLDAMESAGADTRVVKSMVERIELGYGRVESQHWAKVPEAARAFMDQTFAIIETGDLVKIAGAFTWGREDLIPDLFTEIVQGIAHQHQAQLAPFEYYLQRHIELDGDEHGPLAMNMIQELCGDNPENYQAAGDAAIEALQARLALWDAMWKAIQHQQANHQLA
ncbi:DUF3050 domain-containing protein [Pontibacter sp. G13]|uniref:DUF3050 domain-containing protein n=1 Tax=Pontibacter sp. G13 TaxID=3074898 RepID=UPI00288B5F42|nr:DUF3050 domain-containing protein [Pontibacter sp. G13]WNJ17325.1 DUF3050 domain-containing protein [Pontibacter sp. G13]